MQNPLLSVIVPIYRVERYLTRCLESIIKQTYSNLEIILVDDGSDDACPQICDEYAQRDNRIKVIHKVNGGHVSARKRGFVESSARYIGWVDPDDWIEPNMYQELMSKMIETDCDIVASGRIEEYENGSFFFENKFAEGLYLKKDIEEKIVPRMLCSQEGEFYSLFPTYWDKVFKREILEKAFVDFSEEMGVGEDVACIYASVIEADSIYISNKCLYHYEKQNQNSLTHKADKQCFEKLSNINVYLKDRFSKFPKPNNLEWQLNKYIWDQIRAYLYNLYRFSEVKKDSNAYIFPYELVERGAKVILYGAGSVGNSFFTQLEKNKYCEVVAWTDTNWKLCDVDSLECLDKKDYDYVIIAIRKVAIMEEIRTSLVNNGVEKNKIIWCDYIRM